MKIFIENLEYASKIYHYVYLLFHDLFIINVFFQNFLLRYYRTLTVNINQSFERIKH